MRVIKYLIVLFFISSVFVLFCPYISPKFHWIFSFISISIPVIFVLNVLLLVVLALIRSKLFLYPLLALLLFTVLYLTSTVNLSYPSESRENSFSVLTYNVNQFNRPKGYYRDRTWKGDKILQDSKDIIDFVSTVDADILCIQEYYNDSLSVKFNTREFISGNKRYYHTGSTKKLRINKATFGVMLFSKFPIYQSGVIEFQTRNAQNRGMYADLIIGKDTVRVINIHLESNEATFSDEKKFLRNWKNSQANRVNQLDQVKQYIETSPYPVVLAGDCNVPPYSFVYVSLRKWLNSSFEKKGSGIGATYNHNLIKILRIDHLFHSDEIECLNYRTMNDIKLSDHFPVRATYALRTK